MGCTSSTTAGGAQGRDSRFRGEARPSRPVAGLRGRERPTGPRRNRFLSPARLPGRFTVGSPNPLRFSSRDAAAAKPARAPTSAAAHALQPHSSRSMVPHESAESPVGSRNLSTRLAGGYSARPVEVPVQAAPPTVSRVSPSLSYHTLKPYLSASSRSNVHGSSRKPLSPSLRAVSAFHDASAKPLRLRSPMASKSSLLSALSVSSPPRAAAASPQFIGVSLAAFEAIVELAGGEAVLAGNSTNWLKYNVVLPATRDAKCSMAEWLVRRQARSSEGSGGGAGGAGAAAARAHAAELAAALSLSGSRSRIGASERGFTLPSPSPRLSHSSSSWSACGTAPALPPSSNAVLAGPANVFLSHAYDYAFVKVLDAVRAWEERQLPSEGPFLYYFDLFVVNQHGQSGKVPFEVLQREFGDGVCGVGRTLLVLDWHAPVALSRAWCVFEIFTSLHLRTDFSVIMAPEDEALALEVVLWDLDAVVKAMCSIDAAKASAREPDDEADIKRTIVERFGGYVEVNQLIIGALREWIGDVCLRALAKTRFAEVAAMSRRRLDLPGVGSDPGARAGGSNDVGSGAASSARARHKHAHAATNEHGRLDSVKRWSAMVRSRQSVTVIANAAASTSAVAGRSASRSRRSVGSASKTAAVQAAAIVTPGSIGSVGTGAGGAGSGTGSERRHDAEGAEDSEALLETLRLAHHAGELLAADGHLEKAAPLLRRSYSRRLKQLGADHPDTLASASAVAHLLQQQGKPRDAQEVLQGAISARTRTLSQQRRGGSGHPQAPRSVAAMADLLRELGKLDEAEPLMLEALRAQEASLGAGHPDTLKSKAGLASVRRERGKLADAYRLLKEALEEQRRQLDPAHPDLLHTQAALGAVAAERGALAEGQALLETALAAQRRALGENHPDTLRSKSELAVLLGLRGQLEEAEEHLRDAFGEQRLFAGKAHPDTLQSAAALASVLLERGNLDDAEELLHETLGAVRAALGDAAPATLRIIALLASVLQRQGALDEAEPLLEEAIEGQGRVLGPLHPDTLRTLRLQASLLQEHRQLEDADALLAEVIAAQESVLGPKHPDYLRSRVAMALLLRERGRLGSACALLSEVLEAQAAALDADHPDAARSMSALGWLLAERGAAADAEPLLRQALAALARLLGEGHVDTLKAQGALAAVLVQLGRLKEAAPLLTAAMKGQDEALGPGHPDTLRTAATYAALLQAQGQVQAAAEGLEDVLQAQRRCLGDASVDALRSMQALSSLYMQLRRYDEAGDLRRSATAAAAAAVRGAI